MNIVAPISGSDAEKSRNWVDAIIHYGNLSAHRISIIPTLDAQPEAEEALQRLTDAGITAEILHMELIPSGGWPKAPNVHFFEAARLMARQSEPWFWMEMDCLPIRNNWADLIAARYGSSGARFMGFVGPTPWRDDVTGRRVPSPFGESDVMLTGCSVYPPNLFALPELNNLLLDLAKGDNSPNQGFDIHLRSAIQYYGAAHSELFADKWNTINYRVEDGVLTCDNNPTHVGLNPQHEPIKRDGRVSPQAAVVHGCKDSSLHDLIMNGLDFSKSIPVGLSKKPQSTETTLSGQLSATPPLPANDEVAKLKDELAELKAMLKQALTTNPAGQADANAAPPDSSVSPATGHSGEKVADGSRCVAPGGVKLDTGDHLSKLVSLLEASPKKLRLDQAARQLGIPQNKLDKLISKDGSPVQKGKLGWLTLAKAEV